MRKERKRIKMKQKRNGGGLREDWRRKGERGESEIIIVANEERCV